MQTVLQRFQELMGEKSTFQFRVSNAMIWRENAEVASAHLLSTSGLAETFHLAGHKLLEKTIEDGMTSAIVNSQVHHLAVTPAGMRITIQVEVINVDHNHITFYAEAYDEVEKIAYAQFERVIVGLDILKRRAQEKTSRIT